MKHLASTSNSFLFDYNIFHTPLLQPILWPTLDFGITENSPIHDLLNSKPWIHSFFSLIPLTLSRMLPEIGAVSPSSKVPHSWLGLWALAHFPGFVSPPRDSYFTLFPSKAFQNIHLTVALLY